MAGKVAELRVLKLKFMLSWSWSWCWAWHQNDFYDRIQINCVSKLRILYSSLVIRLTLQKNYFAFIFNYAKTRRAALQIKEVPNCGKVHDLLDRTLNADLGKNENLRTPETKLGKDMKLKHFENVALPLFFNKTVRIISITFTRNISIKYEPYIDHILPIYHKYLTNISL